MPAGSSPKQGWGSVPHSAPRLPGADSLTVTTPPPPNQPVLPPPSPTSVKCTSCVADSPKPRWALSWANSRVASW